MEWCVLPMLSGEGEAPLAPLGVTALGIPWSAAIPATFSLEETEERLEAASGGAAAAGEGLIRLVKPAGRGEQPVTTRTEY